MALDTLYLVEYEQNGHVLCRNLGYVYTFIEEGKEEKERVGTCQTVNVQIAELRKMPKIAVTTDDGRTFFARSK